MKKVITLGLLTLGAAAIAAPAHASTGWNHGPLGDFAQAAEVPLTAGQEIAKVPVLGSYIGSLGNPLANGNVISHGVNAN